MTGALSARVGVQRGDFLLDAAIEVGDGEVLAVLGPNGSGKSTLLQAIAGLLVPQRGEVAVGGRVLTRRGPAGDVFLPPHRRRVGLLGQDPLLFPHLSALENVVFPQRSRGVPRGEAREGAAQWLHAVGLSELQARRPTELSGGQQQRVAIARALAANPDVLLLDEPMATLDVETASSVRTLLRDHVVRSGVPTVLVTHDVLDAIVLADRVAIMHEGRIVDMGDTARVLAQPVNRFAATLVGTNLVRGTVSEAGTVRADDGRHFSALGELPPPGSSVCVVFPPGAVSLLPSSGDGAAGAGAAGAVNRWTATVAALEPAAGGIRIRLVDDRVVAEIPPARIMAERLEAGSMVTLGVDKSAVTVYLS